MEEKKHTTKMSNTTLKTLAQITTGHGLLRRHLRHIHEQFKEDYDCQLCLEADEDPWHLWENCPALATARSNIRSTNKSFEEKLLEFFKNDEIKRIQAENDAFTAT